MEQRLSNTWRMTVNEKKFIETALLSDLRIDGRGPFDYRNVTIQFGSEDGSSEVQLGQTRVMGCATSQLVQPYRDRPNEGTLAIFTEFSPMADPSFEAGRPGEFAVELGRIIDRGLRNLVDAANIAALAALLTCRRPECTLGGEDGQEVIIHPPEVREPLPLIVHHLPIAVTFGFIGNESTVVIDPSHFEEAVMGGKLTATLNTNGDVCAIQKAGGQGVIQSVIMQCLRIASMKAADITDKIKKAVELYNTGRALRKIKRHPGSVDVSKAASREVNNISTEMEKSKLKKEDESIKKTDDMEIEAPSSDKEGSSLGDNKPKSFIGGPSTWDPYSKGVNADELKVSLASRDLLLVEVFVSVSNPNTKMEALPPVKPQFDVMDESLRDADPAPLPQETVGAGAGEQTNKAKTLKDAVKPKHKRKKKNSSNTDGS
ncbi:UNVERIFIED_CONTAM: Exosome complex component RRP45B [Sesamum latifolium]|uniref:Exosome complex component RRP45B n=1 Tax=Sesamum latifolium TaxID=2727402 RepID=A0AAW2Y5K8_9LAMI